jgi:flagellar basal-body rod protein FlgB
MTDLALFDLAARNARWLGARQAVVASNIANAHTPGYKASDVKPFEETLARTRLTLASTGPMHLGADEAAVERSGARETEGWETAYSGNNVTLEQQLLKAGEVSRGHALNVGLTKAFHRMFLASVKG